MTGALIIKKTSGTGTGDILIIDTKGLVYDASNKRVCIMQTAPETALDVVGTISGSILYASQNIYSSGAIIVKTPTTKSATLGGSGAVVVIQRIATATGMYVFSSGATVLALDSYTEPDLNGSRNPHIQFGYKGIFDTNLYRSDTSTLKTESLLVLGKITTSLNASGSLLTNANLTLNSDNGAADTVLTFGSDGTAETLKFM